MIEAAKFLSRENSVDAPSSEIMSLIRQKECISEVNIQKNVDNRAGVIPGRIKLGEAQVPGGTAINKARPSYLAYCSLYHFCNQPYPAASSQKPIYIYIYI